MSDNAAELVRVAELLAAHWDIVLGRVHGTEAPAWAIERGWAEWLLSLSEDDVDAAERHGLGALAPVAPSLRALCDAAQALTAPFARGARDLPAIDELRVKLRKREQVAAVASASAQRWPALRRVVDLGAGHGHVTRGLQRVLGVDALGVERDGAKVSAARALAGDEGPAFREADAAAVMAELELGEGDLLLGLHACGALGDLLVERAAAARSDVLLVSCCLQKRPAERAPLSSRARALDLTFPRWVLGLTNLAWGSGAEGATVGRRTRCALRLLLAARGCCEKAGDEAYGINRRRFRRGLGAVAPIALARRGLAPASAAELAEFDARGAEHFAAMRRLSLPRNLLGRVMELAAALDRAVFLEERGYAASVEPMFDVEVSPRNLGLIALLPA
jgi:SAM-dependent methyltransferase